MKNLIAATDNLRKNEKNEKKPIQEIFSLFLSVDKKDRKIYKE